MIGTYSREIYIAYSQVIIVIRYLGFFAISWTNGKGWEWSHWGRYHCCLLSCCSLKIPRKLAMHYFFHNCTVYIVSADCFLG